MQWTRFTWKLEELPESAPMPDGNYQIRAIERTEEKMAKEAVLRAFMLDTEWSDIFNQLRPSLENAMEHLFEKQHGSGLVVTHGSRVIAASLLDFNQESENHLVTGPCVSVEYRNRGIGSALLFRSLEMLRDAGLETAVGKTRKNGQPAKHLYSKFGSKIVVSEAEAAPLLAEA